MKRHIPNILSFSRVIAGAALLPTPLYGPVFWSLYLWCGLSDMLDGFLARRWRVSSPAGALIDSVADIVFVLAAGIRILPTLDLPIWIWVFVGAVAAVRIFNLIYGYVRLGHPVLLHTAANKATGLVLFALPLVMLAVPAILPAVFACILAFYASLQESAYILSGAAEK